MRSRVQAFTLFEVSVALVIMALLAGTVLTGKQLYKAHQMRQVMVQAYGYVTAFDRFQQQYKALPGDMANATDIWGRVGGGKGQCANPDSTAGNEQGTCNGDGDGMLNWYKSSSAAPLPHETFRAWQHLALAGFIKGHYSGVGTTKNYGVTSASGLTTLPGWKYMAAYGPSGILPQGPLGNTEFAWFGGLGFVNNSSSPDAVFFDGDYTNSLLYGSYGGGTASAAPGFTPALTGDQQAMLDEKNDDGMPATGLVRALKRSMRSANSCITGTGETASYNLIQQNVECSIVFMTTEYAARAQEK